MKPMPNLDALAAGACVAVALTANLTKGSRRRYHGGTSGSVSRFDQPENFGDVDRAEADDTGKKQNDQLILGYALKGLRHWCAVGRYDALGRMKRRVIKSAR